MHRKLIYQSINWLSICRLWSCDSIEKDSMTALLWEICRGRTACSTSLRIIRKCEKSQSQNPKQRLSYSHLPVVMTGCKAGLLFSLMTNSGGVLISNWPAGPQSCRPPHLPSPPAERCHNWRYHVEYSADRKACLTQESEDWPTLGDSTRFCRQGQQTKVWRTNQTYLLSHASAQCLLLGDLLTWKTLKVDLIKQWFLSPGTNLTANLKT